MTDWLFDPFSLPYVQRATAELLILALVAAVVGPWVVLRSLSFYSHAVGVSTFPGLVLADGIGFSAQALALGTAGAFTLLTSALGRVRNTATDAVTALVLVGCLAAGVILASDVFTSGVNVDSLLFGSLLSIDTGDLTFAAGTAAIAVLASMLFGRHWLARGFDDQVATEVGSGSRFFDAALLATVAIAVISTLNAVGALLVIALLVVPAATARMVVRRVSTLQVGTLGLAILEGIGGIWLSVKTDAPPGATIAALSGVVFAVVALGRFLRSRRGVRRGLGPAGAMAAGATLLIGCGPGGGAGVGGSDTVSAIATTTQIADVVRQVGGRRVEVTQLLQPNSDPHQYEPRPSDIEAFPEAEVIFVNGGDLDAWVRELIDDGGSDARVVDLGEGIPVTLAGDDHAPVREGHGDDAGEIDSHWWHDPTNVEAASSEVAAQLGRLDPGSRPLFTRNARSYNRRLRSLDREIEACIGRIPAVDRKLVTDHEAFGYFAERYGLQVIGTVIPALTTQAEPSAGDLADLEETIREEGVKAVFPERSLPGETAEAIARDTGASAAWSLYGDSLGPVGSDSGTYVGMMESNADRIVRGLSGGEARCTFG